MNQKSFFPQGLTGKQNEVLSRLSSGVSSSEPAKYLALAEAHLDLARSKLRENPEINLRLCEAIVSTFRSVITRWAQIPEHARQWLCGAMCYFASFEDEVPDFTSYVGFEDDVEVLNSCLRLAEFDSMAINPEDFDNG